MIYLASPFSDPSESIRRWRYEQALAATARLMKQGRVVFSPIAYSYHLAKDHDMPNEWEFWERIDISFLETCREVWVYMLPGWDKSKGVAAEVNCAKMRRKIVRYIEPFEDE